MVILMFCTGCASRMPIQVRNAGDQVLDLRFAAILKQAFGNSTTFELTDRTRSNMLIATTRPVDQVRVGNHVEMRYAVDVVRYGKAFGISRGQCQEDALAQCAAIVVRDTRFFVDSGR